MLSTAPSEDSRCTCALLSGSLASINSTIYHCSRQESRLYLWCSPSLQPVHQFTALLAHPREVVHQQICSTPWSKHRPLEDYRSLLPGVLPSISRLPSLIIQRGAKKIFLTLNQMKSLFCSRTPSGFLLPIKRNANSFPSLASTLWLDLRVTALGYCRGHQSYYLPCRWRLCFACHIVQLPSPTELQPHQPSFWSSNLSRCLLYHRAFVPAATSGWSILHLNFTWLAPGHPYLYAGVIFPERIS